MHYLIYQNNRKVELLDISNKALVKKKYYRRVYYGVGFGFSAYGRTSVPQYWLMTGTFTAPITRQEADHLR
jgi:hypothetical protein